MVNSTRGDVYRDLGIEEPANPEFSLPKLAPDIDDLTDKQLMNLYVMLTRWSDYFQNQFAVEEIHERYADAEVKRREGLYLLANRSERIGPRGGIYQEPSTWLKAQMESDPGIQEARDVLKVTYARRKLKQMLFEGAERDASVVSRELTRRTDNKNPGYQRSQRGTP